MEQDTKEENNSNKIAADIDLKSKNLFFENKIVPMWVSTKVAASILGISPNALRIRKCRGEIECLYFGKELRFDASYLLSLFHNKRKFERELKWQSKK